MKIGVLIISLVLLSLVTPAYATAPATCSITGVVYDGAGNPVPNAIIYFNSLNTQVVNSATIYPVLKNSTTDANGNLSTTALAQGLYIQITICQAQGGGCSAPTTGFIPIASTTTFQSILAGQSVSGTSTLTGNLNAAGYRITELGVPTTIDDALSEGNPIGIIQAIPQLEVTTATASTDAVLVNANASNDVGINVGLNNGSATTAYGVEVSQSGIGAGYLYEGVLNTTVTSVGVAITGGAAGQPLYQGTFQSGGPGPFSVSTNGLQKPMSAIASLPSCGSTTLGFTFVVNNSDSACSFNSAPTHSTCTVGTNCYTCQVQCAEAGSTSYAWIAY